MNRALCSLLVASVVVACGSTRGSGFDEDSGVPQPQGEGGTSGGPAPGPFAGGDGGGPDAGDSGDSVAVTTVYANTDDSLYSLDPATNKVTLIGAFAGVGGGAGDSTITDCAVNANGDVWVNSESVIYKAALPAGGSGAVTLTKVATIAAKSNQKFYALAFAPVGVLGAGETLVGGDGNGELWSIDTTSGAIVDLGGFGPDGSRVFALSGDVVFYTDAMGKPTGLATIRSCNTGGTGCTATDDYLAGIDMTALAAAFKSGTRAPSLLGGIYGGSTASKGAGVKYGDLFGLGAWQGNVFGFQRGGTGKSPALIGVDTKTGTGTVINAGFSFTNGWSGAGVTTKVTVTIPPPPGAPR